MNGYTREELTNNTVDLLIYEDDLMIRSQKYAEIEAGLDDGQTIYRELTHKRKDNTFIPVEYLITNISLNDRDIVVCIVRDITERKQAEKQKLDLALERERVLFLREFMGNMTHDLKNPLATIKTGLYLLERVKTEEQRKYRVNNLYIQVNLLEEIVDDILTISRLENVPNLEMQPDDLNKILTQSIEQIRTRSEGKQQTLSIQLAEKLPPVNLAYDELFRAILNVVDNAVNYTPEEGCITLTSKVIEGVVVIEVADTGIGISETDMPDVFKRFFRAKNARNIKGGTGLGLAIVKKIIELHGGKITVHSKLGEGTTFHIELPSQQPETVLSA